MKINSISVSQSNISVQSSQDSETRSLEQQIEKVETELNQLSSNEELVAEQKQEKKQELNQQLTELNQELLQRQEELRKEQRTEEASTEAEEVLGGDSEQQYDEETEAYHLTISKQGMEALVTAESAKTISGATQSVATKLTGEARVLESEIAIDKTRGVPVEAKQKTLDGLEKRIGKTNGKAIGELSGASGKMRAAAKAETSEAEALKLKKQTQKKIRKVFAYAME